MAAVNQPANRSTLRTRVNRFWRLLGPGLITGASDDDPSGVVTPAPRLHKINHLEGDFVQRGGALDNFSPRFVLGGCR
jgi:hypothetical protein